MVHILAAPAARMLNLSAARPASLLDVLRAWRRRAAERAELARFDARELQDVGLTEVDRVAIVSTPLWREADRRR